MVIGIYYEFFFNIYLEGFVVMMIEFVFKFCGREEIKFLDKKWEYLGRYRWVWEIWIWLLVFGDFKCKYDLSMRWKLMKFKR